MLSATHFNLLLMQPWSDGIVWVRCGWTLVAMPKGQTLKLTNMIFDILINCITVMWGTGIMSSRVYFRLIISSPKICFRWPIIIFFMQYFTLLWTYLFFIFSSPLRNDGKRLKRQKNKKEETSKKNEFGNCMDICWRRNRTSAQKPIVNMKLIHLQTWDSCKTPIKTSITKHLCLYFIA